MSEELVNRTLRGVGLGGVVLTGALALWDSEVPGGRAIEAIGVAFLVAGFAIAALFLWFRPQLGRLVAAPDVLVPIGVAMLARAQLTMFTALMPSLAGFGPDLLIPGVTATISLAFLVSTAITIAELTWFYVALDALVGGRPIDPLATLRGAKERILRVVVPLAIGVGGVVLLLLMMIAFIAALQVGGVFVGAVGAGVWNAFTLALLPTAVAADGSLVDVLRAGFRASPRCALRLFAPFVATLALGGAISYAWSGGSQQVQSDLTWLPSLTRDASWYETWCDAVQVEPNAFVAFVASLPLLALVIALMLRVVELLAAGEAEAES